MTTARAPIAARLATLLATLVLARAAPADPARSPYAPAPEGLLALVASPADEESAARAAAAILSPRPETARAARNDLLAAGPAGLRKAAETLAAGPLPETAELLLLQVIAASPRREVDEILARAATRPRFEARALAAFGLGAGRTAAAVEVLSTLARDAIPAVRAVALRALFASEEPAARGARLALPSGDDERILALRLRLHRLRGDDGPEVGGLAWRAWRWGRTAALRLEAARCLSLPGCHAPTEVLRWIVAECGEQASLAKIAARFLVEGRGEYALGAARLAGAEALVALLGRPDVDAALRYALLAIGVRWIARPISVRGRQVDLEAREYLKSTLPDAGAALVAPVVARLQADGFTDPNHGPGLLALLPEEVALPALRGLADPRGGATLPVRVAAAAALRTIGRIGDEDTARALLARGEPVGIREDAILALRRDPAGYALPLLDAAARDDDPAVASHAATTLLERPEPAAREALESVLLDRRWQRHEDGLLASVVRRATDADWRLLERMVIEGVPEARAAVFDRLADGTSRLRGPRAVSIVRLARERPELGIGIVTVARALVYVDPEDAVAYVREMSPKVSREGRHAMLRDLQVTNLASAAAYALEVAAATADDDDVMLGAVVTVLMGECPKDPATFDPFWRRLIRGPKDVLRQMVLEVLARVPHGPMVDLALPILRDEEADPKTRSAALAIVVQEALASNVDLLWTIASHRVEDEDLRTEAAKALLGAANAVIRAKALAWLEEPIEESAAPTTQIALVAGTGASPSEAARLLALLDAAVAKRYAASPPYFVPLASDDPYGWRGPFLCDALGASGDAASLEALATRLFDPRLAAWSDEARRSRWLGEAAATGPLGSLDDPPTLASLLHLSELGRATTPTSPAPPEAAWFVDALRRAGPASAADRIARAVEDARSSGRLARVSDAYVAFLCRGLRAPAAENRPGSALPDAAAAAERALALTFPADGAEELDALDLRTRPLALSGRYAEAAEAQSAGLRLAARLGIADLPASIWIERGDPAPPPSWATRKAGEDLLRGAAAAVAGKANEARDAFRRGEARAPLDAATLQDAAFLRATTDVEPEVAEALVRRALALLHRSGERHTRVYLRTLALTLRKQGRVADEQKALEEAAAAPDD